MHRNCNGQYFLLPNRIFDERLSPNEFIVYSFLVRAKDSAGQSFWSVPMIEKAVRCVLLLAEKFCVRWKAAGT